MSLLLLDEESIYLSVARTYIIAAEDRVFRGISAEDRAYSIAAEDRVYPINAEDRVYII